MITTLIVDDESLVRMGLRVTIPWEKYGIVVVGEAGNGEEAMAFMMRHSVDLLFTDLMMPRQSGFELMKQVRHRFPKAAMVVLTCHQDFHYIQECMRLGAIDYIVKTQLELEVIDEVMQRIVRRVHEHQLLCIDGSDEPPLSRKPSERMREEWKGLYWVLDRAQYEAMLHQLEMLDMSSEQQRQFFSEVSEGWTRLFYLKQSVTAWQQDMDRLTCWGDWEAWINQIRSHMKLSMASHGNCSYEISLGLLKAIDYIEAHSDMELQLGHVAGQVNISKGYFSECFKMFTGVNFVNYVRVMRTNKAKRLLMETATPIYLVAEQCGFQDVKYFSKVFRNITGMLPREYRLKHGRE